MVSLNGVKVEGETGVDSTTASDDCLVDVTDVSGVVVRRKVSAKNATDGLPAGLYIVGGDKVLVQRQ